MFEQIYQEEFDEVDQLLEKSFYVLEKKWSKQSTELVLRKRKELFKNLCTNSDTDLILCPVCKNKIKLLTGIEILAIFCTCPFFKERAERIINKLSKKDPLFWERDRW
ncbi:hypothetical protein QO179_25090 [Bacillus stercoris]|nr:hypothetical protein [Bacillus stercoris]